VPDREPTLYDEFGVAPDASADAVRAGYRRQARLLHPDVAGAADTGDAMRRLNQAWAVLGDADQRRRYDESLAHGAPPPTGPAPVPAPVPPPPPTRRAPFLRPSAVVLLVLAVIFVVTAYAGSWPGHSSGSPASTSTTTAGSAAVNPVGKCLANVGAGAAGLNTIVACTRPTDVQILAEVSDVTECPAGTVGHLWTVRPTVLCTTTPPGAAP
jgi:hypothetical protein